VITIPHKTKIETNNTQKKMSSVVGEDALFTFAFLEAASKGKVDVMKNFFTKFPKWNVNATDYNKNTGFFGFFFFFFLDPLIACSTFL
jgi:hypothetical protein